MAIIEPNTEIYLLKSPIELDDNNQLNFANKAEQFNYFNSLPKISNTLCTYQRRENIIRYAGRIEDILGYNYCMYRNKNHGNKWFYAFITDMEYKSDEVTWVTIKEDSWQTWQFDIDFKQSFVEREHVNDDTIGLHTLPEGLDLGEFEIVDQRDIPYAKYYTSSTWDNWCPCFCVTALPNGCSPTTMGRVMGDNGRLGGVFNSLKFFAVANIEDAKIVIQAYERAGVTQTSDAITNIYMIPRDCINILGVEVNTRLSYTIDNVEYACKLFPLYNSAYSEEFQLQEPQVLAENYVPVNNKLYTSPFSYVYMSNNAGTDITLNWQDFPIQTIGSYTMPTINYYKVYVPSTSLSSKLIFTNYKTYASDTSYTTQMFNYGIPFAKAPVCAWTTDYYTNWLTQNGQNMATSIEMAGFGAVAGIATGALTGGVVGGALGLMSGAISVGGAIGNALAEQHRASTTPPQSHGDTNSADLTYAFKRCSISCYFMSVRKEVARVIDGYFSMYGYKVSIVKIPNLNGRRNWNYVKTIGCNITGDVPQDALLTIRGLFDNGVTIWHNPTTFRDYSQNNNII